MTDQHYHLNDAPHYHFNEAPPILDSSLLHTIRHIVRQEIRLFMAGKKYFIDQDQIDQLTGAETGVLQTVSDAAVAVNTEIGSIPGLIQAAVLKALADAGVQGTQPVDITAALQALANIQGGIHNIAVAAQVGGATAPATPAPPVADPTTGTPVPVTDPVVSLPSDPIDTSSTPTAPPAAAGTDGSGVATV